MASLASYTTLYVTAIRVEGMADVKNIAAVRWDGGHPGSEESSVTDFIRWLARGDARAFVGLADGGRGPRIHVEYDGVRRDLSSRSEDAGREDALLMLPRLSPGRTTRKHLSQH